MLRPGKVSRPFVPATFTSELLRRRTTRTLESQVAVMLSTLYLALCPYWGCWCSMSCQAEAREGRRKVQVVINDVAPVCGLSSFIVRKLMLEIDCSLCFLLCRHGWRSEVRSPLSRFTPPGCVSCRNSTRKRTSEAPIMASDAAPENGLSFS